jgi:hypothetical protein
MKNENVFAFDLIEPKYMCPSCGTPWRNTRQAYACCYPRIVTTRCAHCNELVPIDEIRGLSGLWYHARCRDHVLANSDIIKR